MHNNLIFKCTLLMISSIFFQITQTIFQYEIEYKNQATRYISFILSYSFYQPSNVYKIVQFFIILERCLYRLIRSECVLKGYHILCMKNNILLDSCYSMEWGKLEKSWQW